MAGHHVPDLDAIQQLPNQEIRFYATIGAAISLASALELSFLDIFQKATGLDRGLCAQIMYNNRNASYRRDAANVAMRHKLQKDQRLPAWDAISTRIVSATGNSGARNLVGHTAVSKTSIHYVSALAEAPLGSTPLAGGMRLDQYFVIQDQDKILAGIEKPRKEDFTSLIKYCRDLNALLNDLDAFLDQL